MARVDYLDDTNAPPANSLIPAASAIITDKRGRILLHHRSDNGLWALPGGTMALRESIGETVIREVKEETGLDVEPQYVVGIYTNPHHVIAFSDGEVRQEFSVCFACKVSGGMLKRSDESTDLRFFTARQIAHLNIHPSIRQRIADYRLRKRKATIR